MTLTQDTQIRLLSDPLMYYTAMLNDIRQAEKYVYIEIYRFRNDPMGVRFRDTLVAKQKQGVRVKLLIDSWGASSGHHFFQELVDAGGELTFFKKIRFNWDGFTKSHRRDHRKIIAIDDQTTWIGSANITSYSLNWRESMFRIKSEPLTRKFKSIILENVRIHNKYFYDKYAYTRVIKSAGFERRVDVKISNSPTIRHSNPLQPMLPCYVNHSTFSCRCRIYCRRIKHILTELSIELRKNRPYANN
ncbi:MAG: hypothetical protein EOM23_09320 [Candidatus Moranbacteria bacterium]|nr:hypothetical protein [Candidatus Moranbacteria bacterium]